MHQTGIVEDIRYTNGGAGNQWTTIDGVRYATWWDVRTKDWKVGDRVTFSPTQVKLFHNSASMTPCAQEIRKLYDDPGDESF